MAPKQQSHQNADDESRGVTFIVPCFNEQPDLLLRTVTRLRETATAAQWKHEIIIVDDSSNRYVYDKTVLGDAQLVRHKENRGYGAALSTGLRFARFLWIGIIDAD